MHSEHKQPTDAQLQPIRLDRILLDVVQRVSKLKNGMMPLLPGYMGLPLAQVCADSTPALIKRAFDQREGHMVHTDSRAAFIELVLQQANELHAGTYVRDPVSGEWPVSALRTAGKAYDAWAKLQVHQVRGTARPGAQAAERIQECVQKDLQETLAGLDDTSREPQPNMETPSTPGAADAEVPAHTFATPDLQQPAAPQADDAPLPEEQRASALHKQAVHRASCVQSGVQIDLLPASPFPRSSRPRERDGCTAADSAGDSDMSTFTAAQGLATGAHGTAGAGAAGNGAGTTSSDGGSAGGAAGFVSVAAGSAADASGNAVDGGGNASASVVADTRTAPTRKRGRPAGSDKAETLQSSAPKCAHFVFFVMCVSHAKL